MVVIVLLIVYVVTSMMGIACIALWWLHSMGDEPKWVKLLSFYCTPIACIFLGPLLLRKRVKRLMFRPPRYKRPGVDILYQVALTVGGLESRFFGVRVGEFIIRLDSSSRMRSDLRITKGKTSLVIQGGSVPLRVWTKEEGLSYMAFQNQLSQEDKLILRKLASDLAGWSWIWPDIGGVLSRRVEETGEDNLLRAFQNLFRGVEGTMRRQRIPFIGNRLVS